MRLDPVSYARLRDEMDGVVGCNIPEWVKDLIGEAGWYLDQMETKEWSWKGEDT